MPGDNRGGCCLKHRKKHKTAPCLYFTEFKRTCLRGTLAIGITANFIDHHTKEEAATPEIGGVFRIFKPELFQIIQDKTGMDLETVVYYKNETHYFVMSMKRPTLLKKGVLLKVKSGRK